MKKLIIYYSRSGTTKKVAEAMQKITNLEIAEIVDIKDRSGASGYLFAGRDAMQKRLTEIKPIDKNLSDYDAVIVGTPVWAWTVSVPVRTFLRLNQGKIKKLACFCTMGSSGEVGTFKDMEIESGLVSTANLALLTKEVAQENCAGELKKFIANVGL